MVKRIVMTLALVAAAVSLNACARSDWKLDPSADFFPLKTNMVWTYRVASKSQAANYAVTDRVVGLQYVPALKVTGLVVEEYYNLDRAGLRPIVYLAKGGFLSRLSGLDYVQHQIEAPTWGRSEEDDFLPTHLTPDFSWKNVLFPYGKMPGGLNLSQSHKSFIEDDEIAVPAGHFKNCIRIETQTHYDGGPYAARRQNLNLAYKDWYAPNVGLVRTVAYRGGPGGPEMERVELIRFDAAPKSSASSGPAAAASQNSQAQNKS